ncbi:MAG: U32 family peptidase [Myxococcota bacterium]
MVDRECPVAQTPPRTLGPSRHRAGLAAGERAHGQVSLSAGVDLTRGCAILTHSATGSDSPFTIVCGCSQQTSEAELRALLDAGVGEIYAGYAPRRWLDRLGIEVSPNRRYQVEGQLTDSDQLRRHADIVRGAGAAFVLAINDHSYAPAARALLDDVVAAGLDAGATGFIVADLSLLADLRNSLAPEITLIASTEAGTYNAEMAALQVEKGAQRIVFPREMELGEMAAIVGALAGRDIAFEAFVAREYCIHSSAVCFATHGYGHAASFCAAWNRRQLADLRTGATTDLPACPTPWPPDLPSRQAMADLHRCGFCALQRWQALGIRYLKVPGRSSSALAAVRRLRQVLDGKDLSPQACRHRLGSATLCDGGQFCYYDLDAADVATPTLATPDPTTATLAPHRHHPREPAPGHDAAAHISASPQEVESGLYLSSGTWPIELLDRLQRLGLAGAMRDDLFAGAWERAAAERALAVLPSLGIDPGQPPTRVYLGLELCGLRLPSRARLAGEVDRLLDAGLAVSLVAPVTYQRWWQPLLQRIEPILAAHPQVELVVNDPGLLRYASRVLQVPVATGRIFNRMRRDPFAGEPNRPSPAHTSADRKAAVLAVQDACHGHPYLADPFHEELLAAQGVVAVGTDVLPTALSGPLAAGVTPVLYLPWAYVASTRACPTAAHGGGSVSHPTRSCAQPCQSSVALPEYAHLTRRVVQRGAGTFLDVSADIERFVASMRPSPGRVVFEPYVPF